MRQLLGIATLELTKWCVSSGCSKFFQILKIPHFSLLGAVTTALCAPQVLDLGSNQCDVSQVLLGMGGMSSPGPGDSPNHRIMESNKTGRDVQCHRVQSSTNHHLLNKTRALSVRSCQSQCCISPSPFFLEKPEEICLLDKFIRSCHLDFYSLE